MSRQPLTEARGPRPSPSSFLPRSPPPTVFQNQIPNSASSLFSLAGPWLAAEAETLTKPFCLSPQTPTTLHQFLLDLLLCLHHTPTSLDLLCHSPGHPRLQTASLYCSDSLIFLFLSANGGCKQAATQTDRVRQGVN